MIIEGWITSKRSEIDEIFWPKFSYLRVHCVHVLQSLVNRYAWNGRPFLVRMTFPTKKSSSGTPFLFEVVKNLSKSRTSLCCLHQVLKNSSDDVFRYRRSARPITDLRLFWRRFPQSWNHFWWGRCDMSYETCIKMDLNSTVLPGNQKSPEGQAASLFMLLLEHVH